jgi:hypothetical protein
VADFAKMEQVGFLYNLCFLWDFGAGFSAQMSISRIYFYSEND